MQNLAKQQVQLPKDMFSEEGIIEALTFSTGATHYAIPISQVRYIEQITKPTRRVDTENGPYEVTDYQGKAVRVVDFALLTHGQSSHEENAALIRILEQREQDHIEWLAALEDSVQNGTPFTKSTNPHQCAFGKWYDQFEPEDDLLSDIMKDFDAPHKHIHSLAEKMLGLVEDGQQETALEMIDKERHTTLAKLHNLFDTARDRIKSMNRPVFVFVCNKRNGLVALKLDAIEDIILFDQKSFANYDSMQGALGKNLDIFAGYLSETGTTLTTYLLLDWRLFDH